MKALTFFLLAMITTFFSFGQALSHDNSSAIPTPTPQSALFLNSNNAELASTQKSSSDEYSEADYRGRGRQAVMSCERIKVQRTIGIVFTAIGGALLGSGIAMTVAGNRAIYNDSYYNPYGYYVPAPQSDFALRNGGVACTVLGLGSLALGIPNLIVGSIRYKKYCGGVFDRDRSYLELHPGLNTMGLAMKF